jgi:hypothetical protein
MATSRTKSNSVLVTSWYWSLCFVTVCWFVRVRHNPVCICDYFVASVWSGLCSRDCLHWLPTSNGSPQCQTNFMWLRPVIMSHFLYRQHSFQWQYSVYCIWSGMVIYSMETSHLAYFLTTWTVLCSEYRAYWNEISCPRCTYQFHSTSFILQQNVHMMEH